VCACHARRLVRHQVSLMEAEEAEHHVHVWRSAGARPGHTRRRRTRIFEGTGRQEIMRGVCGWIAK
jgi:hypothetical protein